MSGNDYLFVFEGDYVEKAKDFLTLLASKWSDKIKITKPGKLTGTSKKVYKAEILVRDSRLGADETGYLQFNLTSIRGDFNLSSAVKGEFGKFTILRFRDWYEVLDSDQTGPCMKFFYDVFFEVCKALDPIFGCADDTVPDERPCMDQIEFYRDPYLFCLEPPLFSYYDPVAGSRSFIEFLHRRDSHSKLAEIKKVLSRDELIGILKKYCERVVVCKSGGVGIFKNEFPQACHPRYFLRQELRKRGVKLVDGLAEKYAKEFSVK